MHRADNLTTYMCQLSSRVLNLLKPSGPVQARNGTALPLYRTDKKIKWSPLCLAVLTELMICELMGNNSMQ